MDRKDLLKKAPAGATHYIERTNIFYRISGAHIDAYDRLRGLWVCSELTRSELEQLGLFAIPKGSNLAVEPDWDCAPLGAEYFLPDRLRDYWFKSCPGGYMCWNGFSWAPYTLPTSEMELLIPRPAADAPDDVVDASLPAEPKPLTSVFAEIPCDESATSDNNFGLEVNTIAEIIKDTALTAGGLHLAPGLPKLIAGKLYRAGYRAQPAAVEWDGQGLPPVGTVCEVKRSDLKWYPCEIFAIRGKEALFDLDEGHADCWDSGDASLFRPRRTPEQIAAEEREKEIDDLCAQIVWHYGAPKMAEHYHELAVALHAKGYRLTEGGEK